MPSQREQTIRERAHAIWEEEGRPDGKAVDHWLRAEAEVNSFVPFDDADDIGDRFLSLLHRLGINPPCDSGLEDELLSLTNLIEVMRNPNLAQGPNKVSILRSAAGIHDLASKVLSVVPISEFQNFVPHLRLINQSKVRVASLGQNTKSEHDDDTARKIAELYIGCLAAHVGTEVDLNSPTKAKGDNPDVIFTVKETSVVKQPQRWALAIKTISSRQGQTIFERIKDGARQIDDPKCTVDVGMVIINAKSALDHSALWDASFPNLQEAIDALGNQLARLADAAAADRPQEEWDDLFKGKVVRPVIFMGQSLVCLPTAAHTQTPTALKMFKAYGAQGDLHPVGVGLAHAMNEHMQHILRGIPGSPGQPPH